MAAWTEYGREDQRGAGIKAIAGILSFHDAAFQLAVSSLLFEYLAERPCKGTRCGVLETW